jgi:hypothetical protein
MCWGTGCGGRACGRVSGGGGGADEGVGCEGSGVVLGCWVCGIYSLSCMPPLLLPCSTPELLPASSNPLLAHTRRRIPCRCSAIVAASGPLSLRNPAHGIPGEKECTYHLPSRILMPLLRCGCGVSIAEVQLRDR